MEHAILNFQIVLFFSLLLLLNSCVSWVQVSSHTYPDSVGKEIYVIDNSVKEVDVYRFNDKFYAKISYIKVSARGKLFSLKYSDLTKTTIYDYPVSHHSRSNDDADRRFAFYEIDFIRDNNTINAFIKNKTPYQFFHLETTRPILQAHRIYNVPQSPFSPIRNKENYCMMCITSPLFVVDSVLSVTGTLGAHIFYNLPKSIYLIIEP